MRPNVSLHSRRINAETGNSYEQVWEFELDPGIVHHTITLHTNLKNVGTIGRLSIDLNGTEVCYAENKILDLLDKAHSRHQEEGVFTWDLSNFENFSIPGKTLRELQIMPSERCLLKVAVKAKGEGDPDIPNIILKSWISDLTADSPRVTLPWQKEHTHHVPGDGSIPFNVVDSLERRGIEYILFDESKVQINEIVMKLGKQEISRFKRNELDYELSRMQGIAPPAGYCYFNLLYLGLAKSEMKALISNGKRLNFELNVTGTGALKYYVSGVESI